MNRINKVNLIAKNKQVITGSEDQTIKIWDLAAKEGMSLI